MEKGLRDNQLTYDGHLLLLEASLERRERQYVQYNEYCNVNYNLIYNNKVDFVEVTHNGKSFLSVIVHMIIVFTRYSNLPWQVLSTVRQCDTIRQTTL